MFSPAPRSSAGGSRRTSRGLGGTPGPSRRSQIGTRAASRRLTTPLRSPSDARSAGDVSMESEGGETGRSREGERGESEMEVDAGVDVLAPVGIGGGARGGLGGLRQGLRGGGGTGGTGGTVFAQSEEMCVTLGAQLPMEVQAALKNADFARDAFTGSVLPSSEYSFIASSRTCFVWKHTQNVLVAPTCYIFPCPTDDGADTELLSPNSSSSIDVDGASASTPFGALVSYGAAREPGLILVSRGGELRFWDSVGLGLTGGDFTDASSLALQSGEWLTGLINTDFQTFTATTSRGRLFLLTVTSTLNKFHVAHRPFTYVKPQSGALSVFKQLWPSSQTMQYVGGYITAAAVVELGRTREEYCVVSCVDRCLLKWKVKEGWEEIGALVDVGKQIEAAVKREDLDVFYGKETLDLELDDICFAEDSTHPILLVSFAGVEDYSDIDTRPRRFYAIVKSGETNGQFIVESVRPVPYQTISPDRANIEPRLRLLNGGSVCCVQFGDAITLVSNISQYSSVLSLKLLQDRTFGCGVVKDEATMLFMNGEVLMKVELDLKKIKDFDAATGRGTSIKSIMTQAILFGSNPKNPLLFTFPPDVDEESLISGAEQLSRAVLSSDNEIVRANPDLTRQILERKERLRFLIGFINENGALGKMSQTSRQRLAVDAEILYAAQQLWEHYCYRANGGYQERLLPTAIQAYMDEAGEGYHEDPMRAFFRLQTRDLGKLMPYVTQYMNETLSSWEALEQLPDVLPRANSILLTILESAWEYRDTNAGVYGIVPPLIRAWTSTETMVNTAVDLFNRSTKFVEEAEPEDAEVQRLSTAEVVKETKSQLPALAAIVFRCCSEREEWLESSLAADEPGIESKKINFRERFQQLRPVVLQALLKLDLGASAFEIAEAYRDFRSLVELCYTTSPVFPLPSNPNAARIEHYIETYKEEFTEELFQWYIEHSELRSLFALGDVYTDYVDSFFAKHPHPSLSWIHDLGKGRWETASVTLLKEANHTADLSTRHIMLSIGKLSQLAHVAKTNKESQTASSEDFHDSLDYISVHQKLAGELKEPLKGSRSRQSLENQVDAVTKATAKRLKSFPSFISLYKSCVRNILQGHVLALEDMVDILTLKEKADDHAIALQLIRTATEIPEGRRLSAFRTVWRRIYIHDNWRDIRQTANTTDAQLTAKFKRTSLFSTVRDALENEDDPNANILSLDEAAILPTEDELASRWPGHSVEQIAELLRDYEEEKRQLEEMDLQPIVERVKELALQELEPHDVEMQ